jgi:hypothetical protein
MQERKQRRKNRRTARLHLLQLARPWLDKPFFWDPLVALLCAVASVIFQSFALLFQTADGQHTLRSTYEYCQFIGAMSCFPVLNVWKVTTELKCKFFAWLSLHNKAPTTDSLHNRPRCVQRCSLAVQVHAHTRVGPGDRMQKAEVSRWPEADGSKQDGRMHMWLRRT